MEPLTPNLLDAPSLLSPALEALPPVAPKELTDDDYREFSDTAKTRASIYNNVLSAAQGLEPVSNERHTLRLTGVDYQDPDIVSKRDQKAAILNGLSKGRRLRGTWELLDNLSGEIVDSKRSVLMTVPHMTERGTFSIMPTVRWPTLILKTPFSPDATAASHGNHTPAGQRGLGPQLFATGYNADDDSGMLGSLFLMMASCHSQDASLLSRVLRRGRSINDVTLNQNAKYALPGLSNFQVSVRHPKRYDWHDCFSYNSTRAGTLNGSQTGRTQK